MVGFLKGALCKFLTNFILIVLFATTMHAQDSVSLCQQSLTILKNAVVNSETFFIKVHAAENLIYHHHPEGLEAQFLQLQKQSPDNNIGSIRVLARLSKDHPEKYRNYITQLLQLVKSSINPKIQLTALESLGKLGYHEALPAIKAAADTGKNGFKGMARWILANRNTNADENRLSELLLSKDETDYRYAAYALRFQHQTNLLTIKRLEQCMLNIDSDDAAQVYVLSCLFVHADESLKHQIKPELLNFLKGKDNQRYETAEALGIGGNKSDIPVLQALLADQNTDVQVAAANAMLRLLNYKK